MIVVDDLYETIIDILTIISSKPNKTHPVRRDRQQPNVLHIAIFVSFIFAVSFGKSTARQIKRRKICYKYNGMSNIRYITHIHVHTSPKSTHKQKGKKLPLLGNARFIENRLFPNYL